MIKNLALIIGFPIMGTGAVVGTFLGMNFKDHHNVQYRDPIDKSVVLQKIDGILSYSQFNFYADSKVGIYRTSANCGSYTVFRDNDGDKLVDRILTFCPLVRGQIGSSNLSNLNRDEHFQYYGNFFQDADKEFQGQYGRFKPTLDEFLAKEK